MRKKRGRRLTHIHTDCGHVYRTAYPASVLAGCTTDCADCGSLLIFPENSAGTAVRARLFHVYLNELDPCWPKDGSNTGYVEF